MFCKISRNLRAKPQVMKSNYVSNVGFMQISRIPELWWFNATCFLIESHSWNIFIRNWKSFHSNGTCTSNRHIWRWWYSNIARSNLLRICADVKCTNTWLQLVTFWYVCFSEFVTVFQLILIFVGKGHTMTSCVIGDNKFYRLCAANHSREPDVLSGLNTSG